MHKLYEYLCDELKDLEKKVETGQKLSMAEMEYMDKLMHTKKNLLKIEEMEDDGEYSHMADGMRRSRGYSMDDDGMMYRGNSYARGRGRNAKRDAMGRYSAGYSRAEDDFMAELRELMEDAPDEHKRQKIQRLINEMDK